jgi:uncharacterized protein YoxC
MATELAAVDPGLYMGMPLPLLLALVALAGPVLTVAVTQWVKKFRTPEDSREETVVVLDASDKLIQRFQQIVADSDKKHAEDIKKLAEEVQALREELDVVKQERMGLRWALQQVIRIARKYGGEAAQAEIDQLDIAPSALTR